MAYDKKSFLKSVTVLCDTREQENRHILSAFDRIGVAYRTDRALPFGDYSFMIQDRDFSLSCVVERKANINEFYGNITGDRERIEKEFTAAASLTKQFVLLLENCESDTYLSNYAVPAWEMRKYNRKIKEIGQYCYATIQSWKCGNRHNFSTIYVKDPADTAVKLLECFYWYWRNFKLLTASRRNRGA